MHRAFGEYGKAGVYARGNIIMGHCLLPRLSLFLRGLSDKKGRKMDHMLYRHAVGRDFYRPIFNTLLKDRPFIPQQAHAAGFASSNNGYPAYAFSLKYIYSHTNTTISCRMAPAFSEREVTRCW